VWSVVADELLKLGQQGHATPDSRSNVSEHHAEDAVDAEPRVPETGVGHGL